MKVIKFSLLVCILNLWISCNAEITSGKTVVFISPDKQESIILYDNVRIECGLQQGKWIPIVFYIPSTKSFFEGYEKLKKGDFLIDSSGRKIGEVISNFTKSMPLHNTKLDSYEMRISGYILIENIKQNSIPENQLALIINSNKDNLDIDYFKDFMKEYKFYEIKDFLNAYPNYKCYYYYVGYLVNNSIHLIFENNKLIGVLHTRILDNCGFEEIKLEQNNLLWIKKSDINEKNKFVEIYKRKYESY